MSFVGSFSVIALVVALLLGPMAIVWGLISLSKRFRHDRSRRSPLTSELLRTPGFGLQRRMDELSDDIGAHLFAITVVPIYFFTVYQFRTDPPASSNLTGSGILYVVVALAMFTYLTIQLIRRREQRQKYREALAGELATAQLLEPVIAGGGRVLRDIEAPDFNIDHVVVAPGGVFAIETKHRLKSTKGTGAQQSQVTFDGKALHFPDWVETKPVEQARAQARWLSERLTKSTGLSVQSRPVLALPGWFVKVTQRSDVIAINPRNCSFMLKARNGDTPLAPDTIQRIAFQVEQLCQMPNPGERDQRSGKRKRG